MKTLVNHIQIENLDKRLFLLLGLFVAVMLANQKSPREVVLGPNLDIFQKSVRVAHAKELLGASYKKVQGTVTATDYHGTLHTTVSKAFRGSNKLFSPKVAQTIIEESYRYGFDPYFLVAVIDGESTFNPRTVGRFGEIGLMQIKPSTAAWIAKKLDLNFNGRSDLFDPVTNIRIGAAYLNYLRKKFKSRGALYIAAYNMGPRNVHRAVSKNIIPKDYPRHVMKRYLAYHKKAVSKKFKIEELSKSF
ncbi:MAG: lytic transglycosylase domain-containing protein [Halobacteriovoraceae bacterium]|jgi:soluble lytic murein transglycosylase|nr:lytic transglycosylase domain-containing protein [Halobacteriovoraceae bacterium]MBT5095083.1 lytic transglycosylase domain-containing protein [Halobacteriovoraceae bacterium]